MYLSISTTRRPATDLGFLLHKNPDRLNVVDLPVGRAVMAWPEADDARATFSLHLEVDAVGLTRGRDGAPPEAYVNDRAYAAGSMLASALSRTLGTARSGRCDSRPELVGEAFPLEVLVAAVRPRDPESPRRLFAPLGYEVSFDPAPPVAGITSGLGTLTLRATTTVRELLSVLVVMLPVLDAGEDHRFADEARAERLLVEAGPWLGSHPARKEIVRRSMKGIRSLVAETFARLEPDGPVDRPWPFAAEIEDLEASGARDSLAVLRLKFVLAVLSEAPCSSLIDLGCGEGRLVEAVCRLGSIPRVVGLDVSAGALAAASRRIEAARDAARLKTRPEFMLGTLVFKDCRLRGFDAAVLSEVVEHLDPWRLEALEARLFAEARPRRVVMTTPNREYNAVWGLDGLRHPDHRFEWTREEYRSWASAVAERHGYRPTFRGIGVPAGEFGEPTQACVFEAVP